MFKSGTKVYPKKKSFWDRLENSIVWSRAQAKGQDFLYVVDYKNVEGVEVVRCSDHNGGYGGDYFLESDLVPYVEEDASQKVAQLEREVEALKNVIKTLLEVR